MTIGKGGDGYCNLRNCENFGHVAFLSVLQRLDLVLQFVCNFIGEGLLLLWLLLTVLMFLFLSESSGGDTTFGVI